jgi:hypothetical protein
MSVAHVPIGSSFKEVLISPASEEFEDPENYGGNKGTGDILLRTQYTTYMCTLMNAK